jgi:hypothetical protein
MAWSITIGTVKGTVIRLHITFLLFQSNVSGIELCARDPSGI